MADPLEALVARFAKRLLAKLKLAQANGRSGWERDDWEADCQRGLLRHIEKGDPRDVAAYCAFMDHHGWITKSPPVDARRGRDDVKEATPANRKEDEMLATECELWCERTGSDTIAEVGAKQLFSRVIAALRSSGSDGK